MRSYQERALTRRTLDVRPSFLSAVMTRVKGIMSLRRKAILIGAILFIPAATGFIAWRGITITLRAAVPADTSHELVNTMRLVGREMAAQSNWLKVVQKPVETMEDARRAIADREVDLAVLRSDQAMSAGTSVVALLKKEQVFLLAPSDSKMDSFSDLKSKSIGLLPGPVQNRLAFSFSNPLCSADLDYHPIYLRQLSRLVGYKSSPQQGPTHIVGEGFDPKIDTKEASNRA
jgi:hypothetical protein